MKNDFVCGTRRVVEREDNTFRVVCASCEAGGAVKYRTKSAAQSGAIRNSAKACRSCGAR